MTNEPVTRPEFETALEGLRREIQAMGEHLGSDLAQIRGQLSSLLDGRAKEGREVGELATRVKRAEDDINAIHAARREERSQRWILTVGIIVALLGHILPWLTKGVK